MRYVMSQINEYDDDDDDDDDNNNDVDTHTHELQTFKSGPGFGPPCTVKHCVYLSTVFTPGSISVMCTEADQSKVMVVMAHSTEITARLAEIHSYVTNITRRSTHIRGLLLMRPKHSETKAKTETRECETKTETETKKNCYKTKTKNYETETETSLVNSVAY